MAILGFDALGRLALGQLPAASPPITYGFQQGPTYRKTFLPPRFDSLNINIYTNPVPFNQTDWSKPFRVPLALPQPQVGINPNLFTNPVPLNQTDWAKPFRVPHITPDSSVSLNPNLQKNDVPFNQTDWSKPFRVPRALPDASLGLNPNLVPAVASAMPCNQFDWSPPRRLYDVLRTNSVSLNPNLFANPVPFNQTDWSKPARVPLALASPPQPLNINLFTNPMPFKGSLGSASPLDLRGSPDVSQPYNAALYAVTVTALPFNQTDWATSRRIVGETQVPDGLNPNLYTNPVPFNQVYWPSSFFPRAFAQPPVGFNPNLDPKPFVNLSTVTVALRGLPDVSQPYNPNLYSTTVVALPFNQTDWATSHRIVGETQVPDGLNINLFTNPVPFNQFDWSKPQRIWITQPQPQVGLNLNLFTNPVPVANLALAAPFAVRALPTPSQAYNPNLYGVVAVSVPLNQFDVAKPFFPRALALPSDPLNINLFTNPVPFNQYDWTASRRLVGETQVPDGLNINLFKNPVPFGATDTTAHRLASLTPPDQPYNAALYTVTVAAALPFNQYDWSASRRLVGETQVPDGLNPNLSRNDVPIANADSSTPMRLRAALDPGQPLNLNLFGIFVPPSQFDVVVSAWPKPTTAPASVFNPNLSTNDMPFSQFDYPPAHRAPAAPLDLSRGQPNPNIFTNPMPFLQAAIGIPITPPRAPRLDAVNVALLGTPIIIVPLPFNQYDWAPARPQQPQRQQDQLNPTLIASFVPPPPDPEQHSKPFFVTPGRLMNI